MKDDARILAIIPARGGSKGLARKNVLPVGGKPLIAWTIEAALQSTWIDRVILTSDDTEIMDVAKQHGCDVPFQRPPHLATDTATSLDVVLHALKELPDYDYLILLQPTSPLRTAAHIDAAFQTLHDRQALSLVSMMPVQKSPYWMYHMDIAQTLVPVVAQAQQITRRQDIPEAYVLNGAIYILDIPTFLHHRAFVLPDTIGFIMNAENSIDIDTPADMAMLERHFASR